MFLADFCESKFTESRDREWDLSRIFLRVENENESSKGIFWELRLRMRVLKDFLRPENETLNFSRMRAHLWEGGLKTCIVSWRRKSIVLQSNVTYKHVPHSQPYTDTPLERCYPHRQRWTAMCRHSCKRRWGAPIPKAQRFEHKTHTPL